MRFLCLAYGAAKDWAELSEARREELLAADEVLRQRGDLVAVVGEPTTVQAWDGVVKTRSESYAASPAPLVGFSLIEADDLAEAIRLVAFTPCSVAGGAIEVRPIVE